jgi:hypothetical protein
MVNENRLRRDELVENCLENIKKSVYYYKLVELIVNTYDDLYGLEILQNYIDVNSLEKNNIQPLHIIQPLHNIYETVIENSSIYYLFISVDIKEICNIGLYINDKLVEDSITSNDNYDQNIIMIQILKLNKNDKIEIKNYSKNNINYEIKNLKISKFNETYLYNNTIEQSNINLYENIYLILKKEMKYYDESIDDNMSDNMSDSDSDSDSDSVSDSVNNGLNKIESNIINNQLIDYNGINDSNSESNTFSKLEKISIYNSMNLNISNLMSMVMHMLVMKYLS